MSFYAPHIMCRNFQHLHDLVGEPEPDWDPSGMTVKMMKLVIKKSPTPNPACSQT